ncbi:chemotaxis protein CheW [Sphingomonas montana]|uniref:chemotaxis protein CheW n=1 Tax=Sphingomonas montana TaxID=1843236 RepID=UPI00096DC588|nr:chemotaxis protein CheW [Sphingomonas montana]
MDGLMLIVRIAGESVALPAETVESVVEIEAMTAVPLAPPHVVGLAALRSRVVTIVDPRAVMDTLTGVRGAPDMPFSAVVVAIDGHPYGIVVDEVLDVLPATGSPSPLQGRVTGGWSAMMRSSVIVEGRQYLLIDPAGLVAGGNGDVQPTAAAVN